MPSISRTNTNYSDLDLNFTLNPITHDVARKTGVDAVKQSVKNLVLTNFWDRPFYQSQIGSNVNALLFENITPATARLISQNIENTINNWEPRAQLNQVIVSVPSDQPNFLKVDVVFTVKNTTQPVTVSVFLERIR